MKVTMSWANITPNAKKYVNDVLDSGWLSRRYYISKFEEAVARIHHAKYGVLVSSGTDALTISIATLKEIYKWKNGDEVLCPAVTFVATANAILQNGLRVRFVDVDKDSCNISAEKLSGSIGPRTVAMVPVHLFGLPAELPPTLKSSGLKIIEDSCEAFGVHRVAGDMACFSFYMSHHVSTGVGGMILTNNSRYARVTRSYMNHGRIDDGSHFKFGRSGYSSRTTEMEAALGIGALEHYEEDLAIRRKLATYYRDRLCGCNQDYQITPYTLYHSWMFYPILLKRKSRDGLLRYLKQRGVESREAMPIINQPVFKALYREGSCPNAENWTQNGLLLPLHPLMTEEQVAYVCEKIRGFFA